MTPLMIVVGAEKGGVGKTTLCRSIAAWMESPALKDLPRAQLVDCQFPRGDLSRFHREAEILNVTDFQDQMRLFDDISGVKIVDLPAGVLGLTLRACDDAMLLDLVRNGQIRMALLHVLGPSVSSLDEIAEATQLLGTSAQHFIVKNYVNETKWDWERSRYADSLKALAGSTIEVPHLAAEAAEMLQKAECPMIDFILDTPLARGAEGKPISRTARGAVGKWLERCGRGFDRVGLGQMIQDTFK